MVITCMTPHRLCLVFVRTDRPSPSRFEAQSDAVNLVFSAKTQANPESSVGLMSMGGSGPEVLVTLTTDFGKILDGLHRTKPKGGSHLATGINIASVRSRRLFGKVCTANSMAFLACPQAPPKQVSTPTDNRVYVLTHCRRREESCKACQEDEEDQRFHRLRRVRRSR